VAGGVFAQDGSWRVSGNVEIGTRLNLDPTPNDDNTDNDKAAIVGIGYNSWDAPRGRFALIYGTVINDGSLQAGFKWNTRGNGAENNPFFNYSGENFSFRTELYGNKLLVAGVGQDDESDIGGNFIMRLWGNYKFLNGIVFLETAFRGEDQEFWISDVTAGGRRLASPGGSDGGTDNVFNHGFFGKPKTFTATGSGGANYLLTQINLQAINFGLFIPKVFGGRSNYYWNSVGQYDWQKSSGSFADADGNGGFIDDVLKETVFGVKFSMSPIEFAGQFKVRDAGAYIGAKFFAGPVTVGASFSGIFNPEDRDGDGTIDNNKFFKVGGDANFNGGVFAAGLAASLERDSDPSDSSTYDQLIRVQPRFSYNVIPSHLCFALDAGFFFYKNLLAGEENINDITWAVQPQLFWTFLGTGARNGYGWAGPFYQGGPTGFIARYRVVSAGSEDRKNWPGTGSYSSLTPIQLGGWSAVNALDLIFQFNF